MASKARFALLAIVAAGALGCGKEENSPEMGAVAPKPNFGATANAPGAARPGAGADPAQGLSANGGSR
ncbi:MAG: hypothetical protein ACO1SV_12025 [Fimbriimonas sp.]